jgi:adenylate kinase family enzyme
MLPFQRLAIIGSTGSGKSTLARTLSARLNIPHTELDDLHWLPGWQERADEDFRLLVDSATSGQSWIIDGGYSVVRDLVWGRADTIVWLDYGFLTTGWRLLRRTFQRNFYGVPCCNGNYETVALSVGRDSILLWLLKSYGKNRRNFPKALAQYSNAQAIVLRSPRETAKWLIQLTEQIQLERVKS